MKAVQADQERERQRRLEVERGRWLFVILQDFVPLQELELVKSGD